MTHRNTKYVPVLHEKLLYAVVLIVMMLATNNAEVKSFLAGLNPFRRKEAA